MITACATSQNLEFVTCKLQILSTSIEHSICFKTHSNLSRILQFFKLGVYWSTTFVLQHVCCNKGILTGSQILLVKFSWDISLFVYLKVWNLIKHIIFLLKIWSIYDDNCEF